MAWGDIIGPMPVLVIERTGRAVAITTGAGVSTTLIAGVASGHGQTIHVQVNPTLAAGQVALILYSAGGTLSRTVVLGAANVGVTNGYTWGKQSGEEVGTSYDVVFVNGGTTSGATATAWTKCM